MKKLVSLSLVLALCVVALPLAAAAAFENTHVNTGDMAADLIAVAQTQIGYMEGSLAGTTQGNNDCTKYGEWYGLNYNPWCAMFVSWCANQAGIPTSVIPKHASCDVGMTWFINNGRWQYAAYYGGNYTPQPGDIVYFGVKLSSGFDSTHVGIIYKSDSKNIYVLEGNSSAKVQTVSYSLGSSYVLGYGTPDYGGTAGDRYAPGPYVVTATALNLRQSASADNSVSPVLTSIPNGTELNVTEVANTNWGKTTYQSYTGWVSLDYCAHVYTVSFNANGGKNAPADQKKIENTALTLTSAKPERDGYSFAGWASAATATAAEYQPGASFYLNKSVTLYAVWKAAVATYTVSFNANGGSGAPAAVTKVKGTALKLPTSAPTRTGHKFLGWAETAVATSAAYTAGGNFTKDADTTLYAVWQKMTYKVSFDANGGAGAPAAQVKTYGTALKLPSDMPTRDGFIFAGWSRSRTATKAEYTAGGSFTLEENTTLYAVWTKDTGGVSVVAGAGGDCDITVSGGTVTMIVTADPNYCISSLKIDGRAELLVSAQAEFVKRFTDGKNHTVEISFADNAVHWEDRNKYSDVKSGAWYYDAVEFCYMKGFMSGTSGTTFSPDAVINRASFVVVLGKIYMDCGGDIPEYISAPFSDVKPGSYYFRYVAWAKEVGLVSGTSGGKFDPSGKLTREQLAQMLYRACDVFSIKTYDPDVSMLDAFSDGARCSAWAREGLSWAVRNGLLSGSAGKIMPTSNASRAQTAQIIYKLIGWS